MNDAQGLRKPPRPADAALYYHFDDQFFLMFPRKGTGLEHPMHCCATGAASLQPNTGVAAISR